MTNLTPDELGALADLARDERSPFVIDTKCPLCGHEPACGYASADGCRLCHADDHSCYHRWTVYNDRPGVSCGACGGWHSPGENCDLDDIVEIIDRDHAHEGWAIFCSYGSINGPWQIQHFDVHGEPPGALEWETDCDVWEWLYFRAIHGDTIALRALIWVGNENPKERNAIINHCILEPR